MKTTIYAAVIEWPYPHDDAEPALILARTWGGMADRVREAVREFADALVDPSLRESLASIAPDGWDAWRAEVGNIDGMPWINTYTMEV